MKYQNQFLNLFLIVAATALWSGLWSLVMAEEDKLPNFERFREKFDADGDGIISEEEREAARAHMQERFGDGGLGRKGPGMGHNRMLEKFDADGDGTLSEVEKEEAHAFFQKRREQFMAERLAKFDTDGDGELSEEERAAARERGRELRKPGDKGPRPARRHHERVKRFDTDGDGVLSEEEKSAAKAFRETRHAEMVTRFDTDGDGVLSPEEREAARASRRGRKGSEDADVK